MTDNTTSLTSKQAWKDIQYDTELMHEFETSVLSCFCRVSGPSHQLGRVMASAAVDSYRRRLVHCGRLPFDGGNQYECGVLFNLDRKSLQ